jgi:hypothetical protein
MTPPAPTGGLIHPAPAPGLPETASGPAASRRWGVSRAAEAAQRLDTLARRHRRGIEQLLWTGAFGIVLFGGIAATGWFVPASAGLAMQLLFACLAAACAFAVVINALLLADWFSDYDMALLDARDLERNPEDYCERYVSVFGNVAHELADAR